MMDYLKKAFGRMAGWQNTQNNPNLTPKPSLHPTSKGSFRRLNSLENFGVSRKQTTRPHTRNSQLHYEKPCDILME